MILLIQLFHLKIDLQVLLYQNQRNLAYLQLVVHLLVILLLLLQLMQQKVDFHVMFLHPAT